MAADTFYKINENGVPNAMNAEWGITTDFKEITISLSDHKTTDNLKIKKAFYEGFF